jgi:hypothetical protein
MPRIMAARKRSEAVQIVSAIGALTVSCIYSIRNTFSYAQ